jgi:hypothetical protein
MSDAHWEITNLLYRYAECIDVGDFDGVATILAHAVLTAEGASMHVEGFDDVLAWYVDGTRRYPDSGTPRTKHVTTNPIVEISPAGDRATCRSYCTVLQASPPELPLQPIWAGRYHDQFAQVDGAWRFTARHFITDLVGDMSQHILFNLDAI